MPFFQTPNNWSLHYELHGDGPEKVLLVMGFACCKSYWYPLVDRLLEWGARDWTGTAAAAPAAAHPTGSAGTTPQQPPRHHGPQQRATFSTAGSANTASTSSGIPGAVPVSPASRSGSRYQICCFDSRGFGLSGDSLARYSSSSMARDMTALLMHLGWVHPSRAELARDLAMHRVRERAQAALEQAESEGRWDSCFQPPPLHIVGWSMGGMCATELALSLSERAVSQAQVRPAHAPPVADLRSVVIVSSSRGGFAHVDEAFDAEPVPASSEKMDGGGSGEGEDAAQASGAFSAAASAAAAAAKPSSRGGSSILSLSTLKRLLRRGKAGRWGWGRTWPLRNLPPAAGLLRIFRLVFLSLYHSRIERVLELHYSPRFLGEPFRGDMRAALAGDDAGHGGNNSGGSDGSNTSASSRSSSAASSAPGAPCSPRLSSQCIPSSALRHLPQSSLALTSSARRAIEITADPRSGGFVWAQMHDPDEGSSSDDDDDDDEDRVEGQQEGAGGRGDSLPASAAGGTPSQKDGQAETGETEPEQEQDLLASVGRSISLHMTPAQKRRVLAREGDPDQQAETESESEAQEERLWRPWGRPATLDTPGAAESPEDATVPAATASTPAGTAAAAEQALLPCAPTFSPPGYTAPPTPFNASLRAPPSPAQTATGMTTTSRHSRSASFSSAPGGGGSGSGGQQRILTNRDVLSSAYLSRAPFDRYILQYAWALFGHGMVCLTHHVSRARVRAYHAEQRWALQQGRLRRPARWAVITGSADILVHPSNSYHLSEQMQCPLFVLEHVGHMVHTEQPDVTAQLLHAHFTRQPVQHLQAYFHAQQHDQSLPATPLAPRGRRLSSAASAAGSAPPTPTAADSGIRGMTVTPMDGGGGEESLTGAERAELAARGGGHSRRSSFLVQIDDEGQAGAGGGGWMRSPSSRARSPSFSSSGSGSWAPGTAASASSSSLLRAPSSSSQSRRHSLVELRREQTLRREAGCCARLIARLTSIPLHSVALAGEAIRAAPSLAVDAVTRPWVLLHLPSRIFGALQRRLGGSVVKHMQPTPRPMQRTISGGSDFLEPPPPLARIVTT